jgi:hypothetical protein
MVEICNYRFVPQLPITYNTIWHQGVNNSAGAEIFLLWGGYRRDVKITAIQHAQYH